MKHIVRGVGMGGQWVESYRSKQGPKEQDFIQYVKRFNQYTKDKE